MIQAICDLLVWLFLIGCIYFVCFFVFYLLLAKFLLAVFVKSQCIDIVVEDSGLMDCGSKICNNHGCIMHIFLCLKYMHTNYIGLLCTDTFKRINCFNNVYAVSLIIIFIFLRLSPIAKSLNCLS